MKLKESSTLQRISELKRPNPPTPEMVARAQPFRADTLQEFEASIRDTRNPVVIDV